MNNYYEILGIDKNASQIEIKKAYFRMIRKYSPESAPEQFQKIREAYEQLKNAGQIQDQPTFPEFSDPFAAKMLAQIENCRKVGHNELFRDTCDEAWHLFPNDLQFLYLLVIAQRKCGNTGKAVKNAELLVRKDPDNKWFQRELAVSYIERGFTNKAYAACEKAYELGCRDLDFILMYSIECRDCRQYDKGVQILEEIIHRKQKWKREDIPELIEIYTGLFLLLYYSKAADFNESIDSLCQFLEKYSVYMPENMQELLYMMIGVGRISAHSEKFEKVDKAFDILKKVCKSEKEKKLVEAAKNEVYFQRIAEDSRIGETLVHCFEFYYNSEEYDPIVKKYAELDVQLCMIEEREEILGQAEILKCEYADFYEKIKDYLQKLESDKNLIYLKESMQKSYRKLSMECNGGLYYVKYPQEKKRAHGELINEGMENEPYIRAAKKIGRNDPCPCGSGKKYKHCCMNKH